MREALAFEDVTIIPKKSSVTSRKTINTISELVKGISLKTPLISSNMDTVTEWKMAVEMARVGGIGFIHRYMSVAEQVTQTVMVKRKRNIIITDPVTVKPENTLLEAKLKMQKYLLTGALVTENNKLTGILSRRDYEGVEDNERVEGLMTPIKKIIWARPNIELGEAKKTLLKNKIEKLPLLKPDGTVQGLITLKDLQSLKDESSVDKTGKFLVGASVGVKEKELERAQKILEAGADVIVVDVAHGHSTASLKMVRKIRQEFPNARIVAGNVCTLEGAQDLVSMGADCVKVGVGPGMACITRMVAGAGVPQITAIMDSKSVGVPIISDGGIRMSGDVAKAIGAGASTVMIGTLFAGTDESPGKIMLRNGKRLKMIRGMASTSANIERRDSPLENSQVENYVPEGMENYVEYRGPVKSVVNQLMGGLRSGMSYAGANSIKEFWDKCEFMKVTPAFKERTIKI